MKPFLLSYIVEVVTILASSSFVTAAAKGPIVDLGYGLWQATSDSSNRYYNFSNIRYAQPPVGDLRFAAPKAPLTNRTIVNDGQDGRICPQGFPIWRKERSLFVDAYLKDPHNISSFTQIPPPGINVHGGPPAAKDTRNNEDCLFLDVLVPTSVYQNTSLNATGGAPVLVWTFGGGFYEGSKESQGNPAGLIVQSMSDPQSAPGVVYVAMNYRLGALGWLAGPTFAKSGGVPNAGFYDQRFALEWIQDHIHLFGGDPKKVTLMGASAGAASTLHQITAYGGKEGDAPFQQAVLESPVFNPRTDAAPQEESYQRFLAYANASSLADLRAASSEVIIAANGLSIYNSTYGSGGGFGPVVDGTFVPQLPTVLLQQGLYAKNIRAVFSGHNTDEGLIFTDPAVQNTSAFNAYVNSSVLSTAQPAIVDYVINQLYPPVFDKKAVLGYNDTISRLSTLIADATLTCNVRALAQAFGVNKTHTWLFEEGPSLHGEETPYMFYDYVPTPDAYNFGMVNGTVAKTMQDWILAFGTTGNPNGPGSAPNPVYGANRKMGLLSNRGVGIGVTDPAGVKRCEFWEKALYV